MDAIREYLLHLLAAAIVSSVVIRLFPGNGTITGIAKLLCSVFLIICAVKPIPQLKISLVDEFGSGLMTEAENIATDGKNAARNLLAESISEQTEAYILEKAKEMDVDLVVQVEVSEDDIPVPISVCISGRLSPYAKNRLSDMITRDLGIDKEHQIWK